MPSKRRCLVCGDLIFSGFYCVDCSVEMLRVRTIEDESLEEWLAENKVHRNGKSEASEKCRSLENYL